MSALAAMTSDSLARAINRYCACRMVDESALKRELEKTPELQAWVSTIAQTHPHLFASTSVFISENQHRAIVNAVSAVHEVVNLSGWPSKALAEAPLIAKQVEPASKGVFLGFDFHLQGESGVQLIEINTNAGGALLNTELAKAQRACCAEVEPLFSDVDQSLALVEGTFLAMFQAEWKLHTEAHGASGVLKRIAIVDDDPAQQFLAPEFALFQQLFERAGWAAVVANAGDLRWEFGKLWLGSDSMDAVYNRTTDFYLEEVRHEALRCAYEANAVMMTPHPRAHALFASKRNLTWLSDDAVLASLGVSSASRAVLAASVPRTLLVTSSNSDDLWTERKKYFFKPLNGFGSRATYRGDKLTQRVWQEIVAGQYVAQALVMPSQRLVGADNELKVDIRAYAYEGSVQLLAARLYQGQTTNMRTPLGGFAPVFMLPS